MRRERWGTFAVNDHLRPRAFVYDVLLYDRLVIPYPTDEDRETWVENGWKPDRLDSYLELIGERAIRVSWDEHKREVFRDRFATSKDVNFDAQNLAEVRLSGGDPFHVTRRLLLQDFMPDLPEEVSRVWAMAAYPSNASFRRDFSSDKQQKQHHEIGLILVHRFLAPKARGYSNKDLLKQAVELANKDEFRDHRSRFYKWQEDVIEKEIPSDKAVEEMEHLLRQYDDVVKSAVKDVYWKFAFTVIPIGLSLVGGVLVNPLVAVGALVSIAKFMKFDYRPKIKTGEYAEAAMFHDVRKQFGKRIL